MENKEWFIYVVDHHEGPFTADEIRQLVKKGEAKQSSYVWKNGLPDWIQMTDASELAPGAPGQDGHGNAAYLLQRPGSKSKSIETAPQAGDPNAVAFEPLTLKTISSNSIRPKPEAPGNQTNPAPELQPKLELQPQAAPVTREKTSEHYADRSMPQVPMPDNSPIDPGAPIWCLSHRGKYSGPYTLDYLRARMAKGKLEGDAVWHEGWPSFVPVSAVPALLGDTDTGSQPRFDKPAAAALGFGQVAATSASSRSIGRPVVFLAVAVLAGGGLFAGKHLGVLPEAVSIGGLKNAAFGQVLPSIMAVSPEPLKSWMGRMGGGPTLPDALLPEDREALLRAARATQSEGTQIELAQLGAKATPELLVATNLADGAQIELQIVGRGGSVLSTVPVQEKVTVQVNGKLATSPPLKLKTGAPFPQGFYLVSYGPAGSTVTGTKTLPIGITDQAQFRARLAEFNDRIRMASEQEASELRQLIATIDSVSAESFGKFLTLSRGRISRQTRNLWQQYASRHERIATQLKGQILKPRPDSSRAALRSHLAKTFFLADSLHREQTALIERGNNSPQAIARLQASRNQLAQYLDAARKALPKAGN